jgi:hypothetical protein
MKLVPLLGRASKELAIDKRSKYAPDQFKITRKDPKTQESLIEKCNDKEDREALKCSSCPRSTYLV